MPAVNIPGYGTFGLGAPFSGLLTPGRMFFLNDQATLTGDGNATLAQDPSTPARTVASVITFCVPNNGDIVVVGPNHSESLTVLRSVAEVPQTVFVHTGYGITWRHRAESGAAGSLWGSVPGDICVARAPSALPQTTTQNIFTISGGAVWVIALFGIVTGVIQTQANATKLQAVATGLTAVDLCATADITGATVGTLFSITGTFANAMVVSANQVAVAQAAPTLIGPGVIRVNCAASNTGQVQWYAIYAPAAPVSALVAA